MPQHTAIRSMQGTSKPHDNSQRTLATRTIAAVALALGLAATPTLGHAGCGCDKPAPRAAAVRPDVTYAGRPVTLFNAAFRAGQTYVVTFTAMNGTTATVNATVITTKDLADGVQKPQLPVTVPALPLGPVAITVRTSAGTTPVMTVGDRDFTVAPQPIALPTSYGAWSYANTKLAVDRDGVTYLSLDLTGMKQPLVFEAEMDGYPLRYTARDLVVMNTQGFLMQLLVQPTTGEAVPGMFVYPSTSSTVSDRLHYSRHEFRTYFLDHFERKAHAVDATGNWHGDGTRHIDHDHLIVAIIGKKADGSIPAAGATPAFTLRMKAFSLFAEGITTEGSAWLDGGSSTYSYNRTTGALGTKGDVFSNGQIRVTGGSLVNGSGAAKTFAVEGGSAITGTRTTVSTAQSFMAVKVPTGLRNLGALSVTAGGSTTTLVGPGSFLASSITVSNGAQLFIDNSAGPVTIYVTGSIGVAGGSSIRVADPNPENFALYAAGTGNVTLSDGGTFYGVVYAPGGSLTLTGGGTFTGAFLGRTLTVNNGASVRYDETLRGR